MPNCRAGWVELVEAAGVDAFGGAVAVCERECGVHGVMVAFQTSGVTDYWLSDLPADTPLAPNKYY